MKKIVVLAFGLLVSLTGFSQSLFDKYEDSEGVGSVIINKGLISMMAEMTADKNDEEARAFIDLAKTIDNIKVFISENSTMSSDMHSTVKKYVKASKLEELMKVRDGDTHVKFYVRNGKDDGHVEELLMFVTGIDNEHMEGTGRNIETVLLTMTGDIDLAQVGALTKKMNLPKELNKVGEKGK